jgi:D-xylose ABC transporter substrate-binding protein
LKKELEMKSKRILMTIVSLMVILSSVLVACGGGAAQPAESGKTKIGLSFSDFATERWKNEEILMRGLLEEKGYEVISAEANHDVKLQNDQIDNMVSQGVKGLLVVAEDGDAIVTSVDKAADAGVKVIAYDRLIKTAKTAAYLSFDNVEVGRQQAMGVMTALGLPGSTTWTKDNPAKVVQLAGSPTDNNATLFTKGQTEVLQPYVDSGVITIVAQQGVEAWDPANALKLMENILTAQGNKVDAVVASNDGTALGALQAMKAQGLAGTVPISGQDATADGSNSIVKGELTVSILKDIRNLSPLAIEVMDKLIKGEAVEGMKNFSLAELTVDDKYTGEVPCVFLEVQQVNKDNVYDLVVASEFQSYDDVYRDIPADQRPPKPGEEAAAPATEAPAMGDQVEVFSWWTGGGEAAGLEAMMAVFQAANPGIEFVNAAVAGGAGSNARAVLATRLQAGDPPDSWQGHAGQELIGTYVDGGQIEPLNDLYEAEGWLAVMPETLIPLISKDGNIYSVPVNIHRANVLWYNPAVLEANGVTVPTTMAEWFAAMDKLQAAGVQPLALGEQWTKMHLLETVLLGSLGAEKYNGLWDGTTDWAGADVKAALDNYAKVLTYANSDSSSLSWQDAAQLVINGDAAFNVMGDWAEGYFRELGKAPMTDYGWAATPGSAGVFQFLSDSFVLAVGAPHADGATAWLKIAGSKAGQEAFNPVKGSICARTDCDPALFGEYLQSAMTDWSSNVVVGSLTHGVVANDSWKTEMDTALGLFVADSNVEGFQTALAAACASSGPCK